MKRAISVIAMAFDDSTDLPLGGGLDVVFICTGNRARSPFAAELLLDRLDGRSARVGSRGLLDVGPLPALPDAIWAAQRLGVDLTGHRAQALRQGELAEADLVVGFEPVHVVEAVTAGAASPQRAFLISELAELALEARSRDGRQHELGPRQIVQLADELRGAQRLGGGSVADPIGTSRSNFRSTFERIVRLVDDISLGLLGATHGHRLE